MYLGIFYTVLYTFSMATITALVKIASSQYGLDTLNIMFARYNIAFLFSLPLFYIMSSRKCNMGLHVLRGGFLFAGHFCVYQGFKYSNFITATLVRMTEPLLVILLSVLIFKNKQTWSDILYMLLGFSGTLLLVFYQAGNISHITITHIDIIIPYMTTFTLRSDILGFIYIFTANLISATGVFICKEIAIKEDWTTVVFYTTSILWLFGLSIGSADVYAKAFTNYNILFFICIILLVLFYSQYKSTDISTLLENNQTIRNILLLDSSLLMLFWILVYSFCYYSNFVIISHILFLISIASWLAWIFFEFTLSHKNFYIVASYYNLPLYFYNLRLHVYEQYLNIATKDIKLIQNVHTISSMLVIPLYCILIPSITGLAVSELKIHHILMNYKVYSVLLLIGAMAFISHLTIAKSLSVIKPETFASFQYLGIVFSLILSFILFNQLPNIIQIIGASIILLSIASIQRNKAQNTHADTKADVSADIKSDVSIDAKAAKADQIEHIEHNIDTSTSYEDKNTDENIIHSI